MSSAANIVEVAALVGDTARATILAALMEGQSLTSGELACLARISKSTASEHLAKLVGARLVAASAQGRCRYYRIGSPLVAQMLESIGTVAAFEVPARFTPRSARDDRMRLARTCYDHLAGHVGVAIADFLLRQGHIALSEDGGEVTASGMAFLGRFGLDLSASLSPGRRLFCKPCLDSTERRVHLAGRLGVALACRCFERGWLVRRPGDRAVEVTGAGVAGFRDWFDCDAETPSRLRAPTAIDASIEGC